MSGATSGLAGRLRAYLEMVRFSHTIFALPFAVMALFLASPGGLPAPRVVVLILLCMVAARTAAMAYNRLVDRHIDARNPRTRSRHLPAGRIAPREALLVVIAAAAVFVLAACALNPLAFALAPLVLAVLLGYSHVKRFSALCHFVLGLALGLAPLGVFVAVRGVVDASYWIAAALGAAVLLWVAGFDILYACQDEDFDRASGLHSVPARLGIAQALLLARFLHAGMIAFLVVVGGLAGLGAIYFAGVATTGLLLVFEHRLVRPDDLSRLDAAFFTVNGCVSFLLCAFTVIEVLR